MEICRVTLYREMDELTFPQLYMKHEILIDMINEGQRSINIILSSEKYKYLFHALRSKT